MTESDMENLPSADSSVPGEDSQEGADAPGDVPPPRPVDVNDMAQGGGEGPSLGVRLRRRRKELGLSLKEAARRAKLSKSALSRLENTVTRRISAASLQRLAEALDLELGDLVSPPRSLGVLAPSPEAGVRQELQRYLQTEELPEKSPALMEAEGLDRERLIDHVSEYGPPTEAALKVIDGAVKLGTMIRYIDGYARRFGIAAMRPDGRMELHPIFKDFRLYLSQRDKSLARLRIFRTQGRVKDISHFCAEVVRERLAGARPATDGERAAAAASDVGDDRRANDEGNVVAQGGNVHAGTDSGGGAKGPAALEAFPAAQDPSDRVSETSSEVEGGAQSGVTTCPAGESS